MHEKHARTHTHKTQRRYRVVSVLSAFFLFVAFLLLLLVALSLPVIKPIYLLSLQSTTSLAAQSLSVASELRFGVWGVCAVSALNTASSSAKSPAICFGPRLGYSVPPSLAEAVGVPASVAAVVEKALVVVLVLHPIAAGLALLCLVPALCLAAHAVSVLVLILAIVLALVASVALVIDVVLVVVAREQLKKLATLHFDIAFGNGVWMILVAVIAAWLAVLALSTQACYCFGQRRPSRDHHDHHDNNDSHH